MAEGSIAVYVQRDTYEADPEGCFEQALDSARRSANQVDKLITSDGGQLQTNGSFEWDGQTWDLDHNGLVVFLFPTQDNASLVGVSTNTGTWHVSTQTQG